MVESSVSAPHRLGARRPRATPASLPRPALLLLAAITACDDITPRARTSTNSGAHREATAPATSTGGADERTAGRVALSPPRRPLAARPEQRWTRGGSERDTVLAYARQAVADDRNVYLLDAGRDRIVALRATDGATAWRYGGNDGRRTSRRIAPTAIAVVPGGGVAVADAARHAILLLDPAGRLVGTEPLPADVGAPRTLCALSASRFLAADPDSAGRVIELRHALPARRLSLPWPDLAHRPRLTTQLWLAGSAATPRCALALVLGRGFTLYDGAAYATPRRYVEPFDLPTVTRTVRGDSARRTIEERLSTDRTAATDLALAGDHLAVLFAGESALRSRLVDLYDARTGAYAGSAAFPHRVAAIAAHGRHLYLLHQRDGRPAVTALALPLDSALTPR